MFSELKSLQSLFQKGLIEVKEKGFNKVFSDFCLYLINDATDLDKIIEKINAEKIIMIDKYDEDNEKYLIIGISHNIIIVTINLFFVITNILIKNSSKPSIYAISHEIGDFLINQTNIDANNSLDAFDLEINCTEYDKYRIEIEELNKAIQLKPKFQNKGWEIITRCISGHFIIKSYSKQKIDRVKFLQNYFQKEKNEIEIKKSEFIQLKLLDEGSSAKIYLIYHIQREQLFVLKLYKSEADYYKLIYREISNYKKVQHPFLLKYYGKLSGSNGIILEYIDGCTLSALRNEEHHFTKAEIIKIIFQIMIALEYLHNNNFIYRDLKPNNIMLSYNNIPVIIDLDRMIENDEFYNCENSTNDFAHNFISPEI